jgi:hypothetical protein
MRNEAHANIAGHPEQRELHTANSFTFLNEHDPANNIIDCSAYDDFLEHIDLQLKSGKQHNGHQMKPDPRCYDERLGCWNGKGIS